MIERLDRRFPWVVGAIFIAGMTLMASVGWAQTTVAVDIDKATLAWQWTQGLGGAVTEFRVDCGGTPHVITDPAARSVPVRTVVVQPGTYTCVVRAANQFGESAPSNAVTFIAGTVPAAPSNLQLTAQ